MVRPGDFVDGIQINFRRLGATLFGAGLLAYFEGLVAAFLSLVDIPLSLLGGLANFAGRYVSTVVGAPARVVSASFGAAASWASGLGPFGFVASIGVALLSLYVLTWVITNVR